MIVRRVPAMHSRIVPQSARRVRHLRQLQRRLLRSPFCRGGTPCITRARPGKRRTAPLIPEHPAAAPFCDCGLVQCLCPAPPPAQPTGLPQIRILSVHSASFFDIRHHIFASASPNPVGNADADYLVAANQVPARSELCTLRDRSSRPPTADFWFVGVPAWSRADGRGVLSRRVPARVNVAGVPLLGFACRPACLVATAESPLHAIRSTFASRGGGGWFDLPLRFLKTADPCFPFFLTDRHASPPAKARSPPARADGFFGRQTLLPAFDLRRQLIIRSLRP